MTDMVNSKEDVLKTIMGIYMIDLSALTLFVCLFEHLCDGVMVVMNCIICVYCTCMPANYNHCMLACVAVLF